jgi:hypothetical protein
MARSGPQLRQPCPHLTCTDNAATARAGHGGNTCRKNTATGPLEAEWPCCMPRRRVLAIRHVVTSAHTMGGHASGAACTVANTTVAAACTRDTAASKTRPRCRGAHADRVAATISAMRAWHRGWGVGGGGWGVGGGGWGVGAGVAGVFACFDCTVHRGNQGAAPAKPYTRTPLRAPRWLAVAAVKAAGRDGEGGTWPTLAVWAGHLLTFPGVAAW